MAPVANAVSLVVVVLMPSARQATSSSRSASQARQAAQADCHPVGQQRQRQDQIEQEDDAVGRRILDAELCGEPVVAVVERDSEQGGTRNAGNAVRPACQALPVEDDESDDLAKGKRHDGEVIAA